MLGSRIAMDSQMSLADFGFAEECFGHIKSWSTINGWLVPLLTNSTAVAHQKSQNRGKRALEYTGIVKICQNCRSWGAKRNPFSPVMASPHTQTERWIPRLNSRCRMKNPGFATEWYPNLRLFFFQFFNIFHLKFRKKPATWGLPHVQTPGSKLKLSLQFRNGKDGLQRDKSGQSTCVLHREQNSHVPQEVEDHLGEVGNSSPQLDIDHSMLLYVYYIRCNHIVCIQLYCVIFNYIILFIYIYMFIYIYTLYIDQQSHLVEETRDGNQQNILFLVNQRWYGP